MSEQAEGAEADEAATLYLTMGSRPVVALPNGVMLAGSEGLVTYDGRTAQRYEHPLLADADEAYLSECGNVVALAIEPGPDRVNLVVRTAPISGTGNPVTVAATAVPPCDADPETTTTVLSGNRLAVTMLTDRGAYVRDLVELTSSGPQLIDRDWVYTTAPGAVVAFTPHFVLSKQDLGPSGDRMSVHALDDRQVLTADGYLWRLDASTGVLVLVERGGARDELVVLAEADMRRIELPGRVGDIGGRQGQIAMAVFDGTDEIIYVADLAFGIDNLRLSKVDAPIGKKTFGHGIPHVLVRSASPSSCIFDTSVPVEVDTSTSRYTQSPDGPSCLVRKTPRRPVGTVLHFHGGPESYEVSEPRMFGLPTSASADGWDWVSINYRGSLGPTGAWTTSAWHAWSRTLRQDIEWVLGLLRCSQQLVLAGWSFGASVALAASKHIPSVRGLLIGGLMADLRRHVEIAESLDPAHRPWFERRFDLDGADGDFLNGVDAPRAGVEVLSFHGIEDEHCPYVEAQRVRQVWTAAGANWRHLDLAGGAHYAANEEDARMIRIESAAFLRHVAADRNNVEGW